MTEDQANIISKALLTIIRDMIKEQDRYRIILLNDRDVSGPTGF